MTPLHYVATRTTFANIKIGQEFYWGSYYAESASWGKKRSSRTADYRPMILGKLSDHVDWAYWSQNEVVYV